MRELTPRETLAAFGGRVRERCWALRLRQIDVAERAGVSTGIVWLWWNGRQVPKPWDAERLARALECHPGWLMFGASGGPPPDPQRPRTD